MIGSIILWLGLAVSVFYLLEPLWRIRKNLPGKWAPLYAELFVPLVFVFIAIANGDQRSVRVITAILLCTGTVLRLVARKRFHIPAWPGV